jgi:hypothetical protein
MSRICVIIDVIPVVASRYVQPDEKTRIDPKRYPQSRPAQNLPPRCGSVTEQEQ